MNKVIVILGPTCVGKTKLSVELAKKFDGEVINADSTQIFKNLNIATAKITEEEKEGIIHHLFDIREMDEDYTVFEYQKDVRRLIEDIKTRGKTPILCGGTGLYIKAALYNYEFNLETKKGDYSKYSNDELYEMLLKIDKDTKIHKNNRQRVERALDSYNESNIIPGKVKSNELLYDTYFIGLTTDRDYLYERINNRVDKMVEAGLLEEAEFVYKSNIRSKAVLTPIGYKELFPYFEKTEELNVCLDKIKQNSRRYAKRQYTWFNNQMETIWFNVDFNNFDNTVNEVYNYIKEKETIF